MRIYFNIGRFRMSIDPMYIVVFLLGLIVGNII